MAIYFFPAAEQTQCKLLGLSTASLYANKPGEGEGWVSAAQWMNFLFPRTVLDQVQCAWKHWEIVSYIAHLWHRQLYSSLKFIAPTSSSLSESTIQNANCPVFCSGLAGWLSRQFYCLVDKWALLPPCKGRSWDCMCVIFFTFFPSLF